MNSLAETLESELEEAVEVKDKKSLHRYVTLLTDNMTEKKEHIELRHEIKVLVETMKLGFENMNQRFEQIDKRFEDMLHYMDKRFEDTNRRIDDANKKIHTLIWVVSLWMTLFSGISVVLKFIK